MLLDTLKPIAYRVKRRVAIATLPKGQRRHAMVGPPHLWKLKREFQMSFLERQGLRSTDRLIDLGCGTLRGGIPIIELLDAGHYCGVDVRAAVIAEACEELRSAGLEDKHPLIVLAGDLDALRLQGRYDYIWSFSVLIHMDDTALRQALDFVAHHLAEQGQLFANVNLGEPRGPKQWQGFPVEWRPLGVFEQLAAERGLTVDALGTIGELGHRSGTTQDDQVMLCFRRSPTVDGPRPPGRGSAGAGPT